MRAEEIREMAAEDIRARLGELEEERFRLKFRAATETPEQPLRFRAIRRDVARLKTILRQRELSVTPKRGAKGAAGSPAAKSAARK